LGFEETLILGFLTVFFIIFLRTKKLSFLKFNVLLVIILVGCIGFRYYSIFTSEKVIFYSHKKQAIIDIYENGKLQRLYCTCDTLRDAHFEHTLESNLLKNSLTENLQKVCLGSYRSAVFQKKSKKIQIINSPMAQVTYDTDIIYLNGYSPSNLPPKSALIVVRNKKQLKPLLKLGYSQIHCLETDGALVL